MSDQHISFECTECDGDATVPYGEEIKDDSGNLICEDCATTEWSDLDFPLWIDWESYNDNYQMLRKVEYETGFDSEKIPHDEMKYTVFSVWFKITEGGLVKGPYDSKGGELI